MSTIAETMSRAVAEHQAGRTDAAQRLYRQVLALAPDHAQAWNLLGVALAQSGQVEEAIEHLERAILLAPDQAAVHNNIGTLYQSLGRWREAELALRRALELSPQYAEALNNLGTVLEELGQGDEAEHCFQNALARRPDFAEALSNLGAVHERARRLDEAVACHRRAIEINPRYAKAHNNLANALRLLGRAAEAAASYRRAIALAPTAKAHANLGALCDEQGDYQQAAEQYRQALALDDDSTVARLGLVHASQHLCWWEGLEEESRRVVASVARQDSESGPEAISPFSFITLPTPTTADEQLRCARRWVERQLHVDADDRRAWIGPPRAADKSKITLGYLSADFHAHATAWLVAELFERHDRDRFRVLGYSYGHDDGSPMRERLKRGFDRFVDVANLSHGEVASRIKTDGVDILVDLKGYTQHARSEIMALRPAPVQVNYLGYPGTMGAAFIDYIVVDEFIVPASQQPYFSERLVHLPGCYQVNDSQRAIAPEVPSRAACGLPERGFVFCSFNNNYKITPAVFDVWMRLLAAVPSSVLWLLEGNRFAAANLRREAQARGIEPARLVFAPLASLADHLARHRLADLFLDTFPVTAHTTASDALWAGCPLVTLVGQTMISRVAGSLLRAVGLGELATENLAAYERLALRLATDPAGLADVRRRLAESRATSSLFDAARFARNLEKAYVAMWRRHLAGQEPEAMRAVDLT